MPDSRVEHIVFVVGLSAILALAIALIPAWRSYATTHSLKVPTVHRSAPSPAPQETSYRPTAHASYARTPLAPPVVASRQTVAPASARPSRPTPAAATQAKVMLATPRGDCWLEVRQESSTGKVVYVGTLAKGKSVSAAGRKLWIRFGAPQNVDLKLNGKAAAIPSGTLDVLVTPTRVQATA
jgi:hypothetical protein